MGYNHEAVKAFKNELRSYKQIKKDYENIGFKLTDINNKIFGFSGPNYDGMPRNQYNPLAPNPLTDLFEKKRELDSQLSICYGRINNIETVLGLIDDEYRGSIYDIYVKGRSMALTAAKKDMSERSLKYWINREIYNALIERDNLIYDSKS